MKQWKGGTRDKGGDDLHGNDPVIHDSFFSKKISPNSRFILSTKLLIDLFIPPHQSSHPYSHNRKTHVLIHKGGLADSNTEISYCGFPRSGGKEMARGEGYPLSPRMMTFRSAFRRRAAIVVWKVRWMVVLCGAWLTSFDDWWGVCWGQGCVRHK
jgi:hypothetical protein